MAVSVTDARFAGTDGITQIHAKIWRDDAKEQKTLFQIVHGIGEHIGRYDRFARILAEHGYIVFGADLIGHGESLRSPESIGDFGAPEDDVRMTDDTHRLSQIMKKRYPDLPLILLANSLSTAIGRIYAGAFPDELCGLILTGTPVSSAVLSYLLPYVDLAAQQLNTEKYTFAMHDAVGKLSELYYREKDETSFLSRSKENRDLSDLDPLFGVPVTVGSIKNTVKLIMKASSPASVRKYPPNVPLLLLSGGQDIISGNGRENIRIEKEYSRRGVKVDVHVYPGLRHEILNEDDNDRLFSDLFKWCDTVALY